MKSGIEKNEILNDKWPNDNDIAQEKIFIRFNLFDPRHPRSHKEHFVSLCILFIVSRALGHNIYFEGGTSFRLFREVRGS